MSAESIMFQLSSTVATKLSNFDSLFLGTAISYLIDQSSGSLPFSIDNVIDQFLKFLKTCNFKIC